MKEKTFIEKAKIMTTMVMGIVNLFTGIVLGKGNL